MYLVCSIYKTYIMLQIIWKCLFQILERNRAFIAWLFVFQDPELTMMRMSVEA